MLNLPGGVAIMSRCVFMLLCALFSLSFVVAEAPDDRRDAGPTELQAGFAETDITPRVKEKTVFMAGFGHNRKATGVHDPLKARAVVFKHGQEKIALVSIDLIGF